MRCRCSATSSANRPSIVSIESENNPANCYCTLLAQSIISPTVLANGTRKEPRDFGSENPSPAFCRTPTEERTNDDHDKKVPSVGMRTAGSGDRRPGERDRPAQSPRDSPDGRPPIAATLRLLRRMRTAVPGDRTHGQADQLGEHAQLTQSDPGRPGAMRPGNVPAGHKPDEPGDPR